MKELEQTEDVLKVIKAYRKILNTIGNNNFHRGIEDELKVSICNIEFELLLDKSPHLIAFQNGTLDLKTNEFQPSRRDDYLTSTLAVQYQEPTTEELKDLNKYLSELFVDPDIRSCVLRFISRMLYGKNKNSKLLIFTRDSSNGKTTFMELLELMFGSLFVTWPTSMLKEETKVSRVTPELERVRYGARIVSILEPGGDLVIMSSIGKRIT